MFIWREFALFSDRECTANFHQIFYFTQHCYIPIPCIVLLREPPRQGKAETTTLDNESPCTHTCPVFFFSCFFLFLSMNGIWDNSTSLFLYKIVQIRPYCPHLAAKKSGK